MIPRKRLYSSLLTLNYLNANEKGVFLERHLIKENSIELSKPLYFKDMLTSEWKQR